MDPIEHQLTVACDQQSAFELFTTGMGTWWDPRYSPDPSAYAGIDLDPRVGGSVAIRSGGHVFVFGQVLVWEPPVRYAQSFWLAMNPDHPSRLDVSFEAGDVCTLHFTHGGWGEANRVARRRYSDWPHLLGRYADAAARL